MKKIYTIFTIALCAAFSMQAQLSPAVTGEFKAINPKMTVKKADSAIKKSVATKAVAAKAITADELAGTYTATGMAALQGREDEEWTVTITKDETDANKVWIQPALSLAVAGLPDQYVEPVYATINADGTLTFPLGQVVYEEEGASFAIASTVDGNSKDLTGSVTMTVSSDGKTIAFDPNYIYGIGDVVGNRWWYQALYDITYTKEAEDPIVYVYEKGNSTPTAVKTSRLYFNDIDGVMHVTSTESYSADKIAGTYAASAPSAFQGQPDEAWTVKIVRDETDATKVWIHPILSLAAMGLEDQYLNPVYATYDEAKGTLKLPMGQVLYSQTGDYTYKFLLAATLDGRTVDVTSNVLVTITDGNLVFDEDYIIGIYNAEGADDDLGWWQAVYGVVFERAEGVAFPLSNVEKISRK